MNRFELEESTTCTVAHINFRGEKHGEETVPAVDIKLTLKTGNDVLSLFDGALKSSLYWKAVAPAAGDPQGELDGVEPVSDLPNLRFPLLGPLRWEKEWTGFTTVLDIGLGGKSALHLEDCKIGNFVLTPLEGGTVDLSWRVQVSKLSEKVMGKLATLIGHDVDVTMTGPDFDESPNIDDTPLNTAGGGVAWPFPTEGQIEPDPTGAFLAAQGRDAR